MIDAGLRAREIWRCRGIADRPGRKIGKHLALGDTAHGDRAVSPLEAVEPFPEQIAARDHTDCEQAREGKRGAQRALGGHARKKGLGIGSSLTIGISIGIWHGMVSLSGIQP